MKFSSPTHALRWYWETYICMMNARSLDVFYEKLFSYSGKRYSLSRIELMATVGYYISKLSRSCQFIIKCYFLANMGNREIAKLLNEQQNTRRFYPKKIEDIYIGNLRVFRRLLEGAGLIRDE